MRLASRVRNRLNWNRSNRSLNRAKNVMFNTVDLWAIGGCNAITQDGIHVQGLNFRMRRQHTQPEPSTRCTPANELVVNLWVKLSVVISHQEERRWRIIQVQLTDFIPLQLTINPWSVRWMWASSSSSTAKMYWTLFSLMETLGLCVRH